MSGGDFQEMKRREKIDGRGMGSPQLLICSGNNPFQPI